MNPFFYSEEAGRRGCRPFPLHPLSPPNLPPLRSGQFRLTIPNTYSKTPCQRRFAPAAVHLRSGTPFSFPPESMFTTLRVM